MVYIKYGKHLHSDYMQGGWSRRPGRGPLAAQCWEATKANACSSQHYRVLASSIKLLPHPMHAIGEMPTATSVLMAPILAQQFVKLQAPPFHKPLIEGVPQAMREKPIVTPLRAEAWQKALAAHPNQEWVTTLVEGMRSGFRAGMQESPKCRASTTNTPSGRDHAGIVDEYIQAQVSKGYMAGPFPKAKCAGVITSSLAVIPKKTPGKYRIIVDMSSPRSASVNDNIQRQYTHVAYSSVEDAAHLMQHCGPSSLLAKIDIQEAYRIVPIHPEDRPFLGICWQGQIYADCQLPFGLSSAPAIFSALGEALEWVLRQRGIRAVIHYLDDFLFVGRHGSTECQQALITTLATCEELGVPLAPDKTEGPTTSLTFLGIELSTAPLAVSLPADKLARLRSLVRQYLGARVVRDKQAFESLVGHLVHATKVLPLGKAFLNALFAIKAELKPGQARRINLDARAELAWWDSLLDNWVGLSVQQFLLLRCPDHHLHSDASGSWGCGAWALPHWFQIPWSRVAPLATIALQELFPIVLAVAVWGPMWKGHLVLCHCDNAAVVSQLNKLHARNIRASHMLRCLAYLQAVYDCRLRAVHVVGTRNSSADELSRNKVDSFLGKQPQVSPAPTQVPLTWVNLIGQPNPDWTSAHWRAMFNDSLKQALLKTQ